MKAVRKAVALLLSGLMLLSLSACGAFEAKIARAASRMTKLESFHMDVDISLDAALSLMGRSMDMDLGLSGGIDLKTDPVQMRADMSLEIMKLNKELLSYVEKCSGGYSVAISQDLGRTWDEEILVENGSPAKFKAADVLKLVAASLAKFESVGQEQVSGSAAERYDGFIPSESAEKIIELTGLREALSQALGTKLDSEIFSDPGDVPASVWLDNKSGMIVRLELDMSQLMQKVLGAAAEEILKIAGAEKLGADMEIKSAAVSVTLSQFDSVGEIERAG